MKSRNGTSYRVLNDSWRERGGGHSAKQSILDNHVIRSAIARRLSCQFRLTTFIRTTLIFMLKYAVMAVDKWVIGRMSKIPKVLPPSVRRRQNLVLQTQFF